MKIQIAIIFTLFLSLSFAKGRSQEPCKVLKPEISGVYQGGCKKGLAHGKGLTHGKDKYEGHFKNGLPHGKGTYTWSTGERYEGKWKEGKRDGEGKYYYKKNGVDSVKIGIWKNDEYYKKITPIPYRVIKSINISRYSIIRVKDGNNIIISFNQNGSTNTSITNLQIIPSSGVEYNTVVKKGFENAVFPFTCIVKYKTQNSLKSNVSDVEFEFELNEAGVWEINLNN